LSKQKQPIRINKYRKPLNLNIGVIIFAVMFIYILICIILYFTKSHVNRYEVRSGSLSIANVYDGIILRDEMVVSANSSGYVNYFAREGEHVASGDLVYTLDQTGRVADILKDESSEILLSGNDLSELRSDFVQFAHNYKDSNFRQTYDFSYDAEGSVLKLSNYNMLNNLQNVGSTGGNVEFCYAAKSGIVVYNVDGYESVTPDMLTEEQVENQDASKEQFVNNTLLGNRDPVYKLITSENWSVVIAVDNDRATRLNEEGYVEVKFLKNQYTSWAKVNVLGGGEDKTLVELQFNNSMITFAKDRYLELEIVLDDETGLKIPNSAIVEKEFYLIPKEYAVKGGNSSQDGFMRETYDEEGNVSTEFIEVSIYSESDTDYYVDTSVLRPGDYICKPDSADKYPISKVGTLVGVYNINKGFADFKEITVLSSNEEYSIVKSNTQYGLTEYDYIVLDAESINEDDFIYE
jgi:hypothetical protein